MTCSNIYDLKKIPIYYEELRGKKLFTKALSEIDVNKKSVHLFYYKMCIRDRYKTYLYLK